MATKTKQDRSSREGVELAIAQLVKDGAETFTTKDVQERAAKLAPAVKDGYAAFWLTKFNQQGVHVERVKRGEYRAIDAKPAAKGKGKRAANPAPSANELATQHTAKELRELAEREGVEVARSATKAKIAQILAGVV